MIAGRLNMSGVYSTSATVPWLHCHCRRGVDWRMLQGRTEEDLGDAWCMFGACGALYIGFYERRAPRGRDRFWNRKDSSRCLIYVTSRHNLSKSLRYGNHFISL